jgi:hypothetical protein
MIKLFMGLPVIATVFSFVLNGILAGLLALTYTSLTKEEPVATITFNKKGEDEYLAHILDNKGSLIGDYSIYGDQWRIDAKFIKMEYWANVFGIDSKYVLDRFEGRYSDIKKQNNNKHKAYDLEDHSLIDTMSFFIDTTYGSSTYKDIKLNTTYTVLRTQTGLMVREHSLNSSSKKNIFQQTKDFMKNIINYKGN